jgi:hypothetical protein
MTNLVLFRVMLCWALMMPKNLLDLLDVSIYSFVNLQSLGLELRSHKPIKITRQPVTCCKGALSVFNLLEGLGHVGGYPYTWLAVRAMHTSCFDFGKQCSPCSHAPGSITIQDTCSLTWSDCPIFWPLRTSQKIPLNTPLILAICKNQVCVLLIFWFLCPLNPRNGQNYDHKQKEFETTPF